jgi:hypothetical protein
MAGMDLRTVQELGGWGSLAMVQKYAHLAPGHQLAAVEALVRVPEPKLPDASRSGQPVPAKYWCAWQGSNLRPSDSKSPEMRDGLQRTTAKCTKTGPFSGRRCGALCLLGSGCGTKRAQNIALNRRARLALLMAEQLIRDPGRRRRSPPQSDASPRESQSRSGLRKARSNPQRSRDCDGRDKLGHRLY